MSEENQELELEYIIPNRAVPLTIVQSTPINENWDEIQEAINKNYDLASQVENKIDITEKGVEGGVATLDINNKLESTQIPDEAKGHVYEVNSLSEQLELQAYPGDLCIRRDLGKSYALQLPSPMNFSSWIEIASIQGGGEVRGNSCYTNLISKEKWLVDNENNRYYLIIDNIEHGQGNTRYLIVNTQNKFGQNIHCDYVINDEGVVTVYSDTNFDVFIIISNLSGNCDNASIVPYCVVSGYKANNKPAFLTWSLYSVEIVTSVPLIVVDGLNVIRNIKTATPLTIGEGTPDGTYILFSDSEHIQNDSLTMITSLSLDDYLGVVTELPKTGKDGQRCYVAYNKSYEYQNDGWREKAFVPIGEYIVSNGYIMSANSYYFMQNGTNVNYTSHSLDNLFGSEVLGLDVTFTDNLIISPGRCLVGNKIVTIQNEFIKNYNEVWQEGANAGCMDPNNTQTTYVYEVVKDGITYYTDKYGDINSYVDAEEYVYLDSKLKEVFKIAEQNEFLYNGNQQTDQSVITGWGYIYLISNNNYDKVDVILSQSGTLQLPVGFNAYRRIGYFNQDESLQFTREKQIKEVSYFYEPQVITSTVSTEVTDIQINVPPDCDIVFGYKFEEPQSVKFFYDGIEIYEEHSKNNTLTLPCLNETLQIKAEQETEITLRVLGYVDRREL